MRRSVLEFKSLRPDALFEMAAKSGVPEEDREQVIPYIEQEFHGLHEGHVIRFSLWPEDLEGISHGETD